MPIRRVKSPSFNRAQMVFDFLQPEVARRVKKSEGRIKRANRQALSKRLLAWMDTTVLDIPSDVIEQLDELMRQRRNDIQAKWTPIDRAQREGLDVSRMSGLVDVGGDFHSSCMVARVDAHEWSGAISENSNEYL